MKRKILCIATAASILTIACGTSANAALSYTAADAAHLRNALLCLESFTDADDINNDGLTDVFDLCTLRKGLLSTGEFTEQDFPATEQYVKIMGRTYRDSDTTWLVQSGSAVEFTVNGKSAEITIKGDFGINSSADYQPRYAVFVNDALLIDTTMSTAEKTIELFSGETSRSAKIKVIHISEANNGTIGVTNIKVNSDSAAPVTPAAKKDLCIEFVGDSITCAYGVEGTSSSDPFKTTTENFMKSYAYLTAQKLDADYSAVCYSGYGIVSGYTSSGDKNADSLVPDCYTLIGKPQDYAYEWDFSKRENDVVVINLGTNDINYVAADPDTRSQEFIDGYVDFLGTIRENNPEAYIICTMGTMGGPEIYDLVAEAVIDYKDSTGDERIMSYHSVTHNFQVDGIGSDWHPSAITQQNSAYVLSDKICQALGMESDQIGLDVAANANYELVIDPDKGANAYGYLNDYDRSYHISTSAGGSSADAVEAVISGIELKKDGVYRLEFDHTTTAGIEVPLIIRSMSDSSVVYFSDTIAGSGNKDHYSAEFTVSEADSNAAIVLQIGGQGYLSMSLNNQKLVKIG